MRTRRGAYVAAAVSIPILLLWAFASILDQMFYTPRSESLQSYSQRLSASATETYLIAKRRDSIIASGQKGETLRPRLTLEMDSRLAPDVADSIRVALRSRWEHVTPAAAGDVLIAVHLDSSRYIDGLQRENFSVAIYYALPTSAGEPCVVFVMLSSLDPKRYTGLLEETTRFCALYYAFGQPGRGIIEWLTAMNFEPAQKANWWAERKVIWPVDDVEISRPTPRQAFDEPLGVLSCLGGEINECESLLTTFRPTGSSSAFRKPLPVRGMILDHVQTRRAWLTFASVGWFTEELIKAHGPDKFGEFWRMDGDVRSTFQSVYGESLGEHVHHWLVDWKGAEEPAGRISRASIAQTLVAILILVALAPFLARRWEIR